MNIQDSKIDLSPNLVEAVQNRLSANSFSAFHWDILLEGGSGRKFYRVQTDQNSWIVMHYTHEREENKLYFDIGAFLKKIKLNVPEIIFHDTDLGLIILEDLGETSLCRLFHEKQSDVDFFYQAALSQAEILHRNSEAPVPLMNGFDQKLYAWERTYFLENLVERWGDFQLPEGKRNAIVKEGEQMADELMKNPRCLIHRDFQSQNLMVRDDRTVWLIDFQGMRLGHAAYDIASLLYDPYVNLTDTQRTNLLNHYISIAGKSSDEFKKQFYQAAAQRLMQALGAYGFLGLVKGKTGFLSHILPGLKSLTEILSHLDDMQETKDIVAECLTKASPESELRKTEAAV